LAKSSTPFWVDLVARLPVVLQLKGAGKPGRVAEAERCAKTLKISSFSLESK